MAGRCGRRQCGHWWCDRSRRCRCRTGRAEFRRRRCRPAGAMGHGGRLGQRRAPRQRRRAMGSDGAVGRSADRDRVAGDADAAGPPAARRAGGSRAVGDRVVGDSAAVVAVRDRPAAVAPVADGSAGAAAGTGPRPAMTPQDAGQPPAPAGWNRDTGEWERAARAERAAQTAASPRRPRPTRPADRAEESARLGEPGYSLEDDFPAGPAGGSGPWPTASAVPGTPSAVGPGKPERHSHRASKHGRPSRWRGSSDRPGRDGES